MIYIICPTDVATGGTEVLHQLHVEFQRQGFESRMVYLGEYEGSPVQKKFGKYNVIVADSIIDDNSNSLIVPEPNIDVAYRYHNIRVAIWWLSVNNYKGVTTPDKRVDLLRIIKRKVYDYIVKMHDQKWLHLVQSEYARQYIANNHHISANNILPLSDYLSDEHFVETKDIKKENCVVYNPKKGYEFTKKLIKATPEIQWKPLEKMTSEQMRDCMNAAKVYIDFGAHPGKDRIPREAAMANCCVITGKMGSAGNNIDVPIPEEFKFEQEDNNIPEITKKIQYCIDNYTEMNLLFNSYREKIREEKAKFANEVGAVGKRLQS